MRVAVTGSHGLIGSALVRELEATGHEVTRIVRGRRGDGGPNTVHWDPGAGTIDEEGLNGHDAVVNLAGAGIGDHRWTDDYKATIRESRVAGTTLLAKTLASLDQPPSVLVSGSAVGYYGYDRGDEELTEASRPGTGFLSEVVQEWEAATAPAQAAGIRVALLRSGIVQSPDGGALARLLLPFRLGVGGRLGSGDQWFSWVALDDEVAAVIHVLGNDALSGPVNLTSPHPVTNADFTASLGRALHRPAAIPVPSIGLRLRFGRQMVTEMLLGGQRVLPVALEASGYEFRHPTLDDALASMTGR